MDVRLLFIASSPGDVSSGEAVDTQRWHVRIYLEFVWGVAKLQHL